MEDFNEEARQGRFKLPAEVKARLQFLLDRQDAGVEPTPDERKEAQIIFDSVETLTLLNRRLGWDEK